MKILITGGAGFIGAQLSNYLISKNHCVHVVDNLLRGEMTRLNNKIKFLNIDLTDFQQVKKIDLNYDLIFHLAAINGTDNFYNQRSKVFEVGVKSILNIYDHFRSNKSKIIVASSAEVYQNPKSFPTDENERLVIPDINNARYSYGGSKIFSELLVMNYGLDYFEKSIIFRPHNIFGPNMGYKHVIPQLINKISKSIENKTSSIELIGDGSETRAFCYIDDLIIGLEILMNRGNDKEIYHIGNPYEISIYDLAMKISKIMNYEGEIISGEKSHFGGAKRRCPNITKMKSIGYEPKVKLDEGLSKTVTWYLNNSDILNQNNLL
jgi:UDP-glucose 4-epimerase